MRSGPLALVVFVAALLSPRAPVEGQGVIRYGEGVPPAVRVMSKKALEYLADTQLEDGSWPGAGSGPGITGIRAMALLSSGEDPDFGPYADNIRRAVRNIILSQSAKTGHISGPGHGPMYHHGLATLALSEVYGSVNERLLWKGSEIPVAERRSIGQALELAVRLALTSQKQNPYRAWRYGPDSQDADTTVSGTVLMGLLGARNAGLEIPNRAVDGALEFFRLNTLRDGMVTYQITANHGNGITRAAIATLVYAIGKRKDTDEYRAAAQFIRTHVDQDVTSHAFYYRYYMAQALFQSDIEAWKAWNRSTIETLQTLQREDGSFASGHGSAYATGMSVLALALNYRLLPVYER